MPGTVVYDSDCGVCTQLAGFLRERIRPRRMTIVGSGEARLAALGLTAEQCAAALQWVEPTGRHSSAAQAVTDCLRHCPQPWRAFGMVLNTPPVRGIWARTYAVLARNRYRWPFGPRTCPRP